MLKTGIIIGCCIFIVGISVLCFTDAKELTPKKDDINNIIYDKWDSPFTTYEFIDPKTNRRFLIFRCGVGITAIESPLNTEIESYGNK